MRLLSKLFDQCVLLKQKLLWALFVIIIGFIVLSGIPNLETPVCGASVHAAAAIGNIARAAKAYADEHGGRLPNSLDELSPKYFEDKSYFADTYLTTPGAILSELPPESIILFKIAIDRRPPRTVILVVRPDLKIEWKRR